MKSGDFEEIFLNILKTPFVLALALGALAPVHGSAQTAAAIAGAVRDTSGANIPGVTVEASSPALIEKVRIGVTDQAGL